MMSKEIKPGYKTSEFGVTLLMSIIFLSNNILGTTLEVDEITKIATNIVSGLGAIISAVAYIFARMKLKQGGK